MEDAHAHARNVTLGCATLQVVTTIGRAGSGPVQDLEHANLPGNRGLDLIEREKVQRLDLRARIGERGRHPFEQRIGAEPSPA